MFKSTLLTLALLAMGQAVLRNYKPSDNDSGRTNLATMDVLMETFWSSTVRGETVSLLLNSDKGETSAVFKLGATTLTVGQGEGAATTAVRRMRRSATASQEECRSDADCPAEVPVCCPESGYYTTGRRRRSATDTTGSTGSTITTTTTTGDRRRRSATTTNDSTITTTTTTGDRRRRSADLTKVVCEHEKSTFECPDAERIQVQGAVYGRNDWHTCRSWNDWTLNWDTWTGTWDCTADATTLVKGVCDGKRTCGIHAANTGSVSTWAGNGEGSSPGYCTGTGCAGAVEGGQGTITQAKRGEWGDPCPGTLKYMTVIYTCT